MLKVVWNKGHTWKILKRYVNGRLESFKYNGEWYVPIEDNSGVGWDDSGNCYIESDCCDNCALYQKCEAFNPINDACEEFDMLCMRLTNKDSTKTYPVGSMIQEWDLPWN